MIRDWDLWPIYLDKGWVDAESAKRLADISRRLGAAIASYSISAQEFGDRFAAVLKGDHPAPPTARR